MDFKNPVNLERIFSSLSFKSRVISAFGLGVLASLIVFSLLPSVNAPPTITSLSSSSSSSSSFFSWVFSINNPPSNSTDTLLAPPNVNITTPSDLGTTHFMNSSDLLGRQPRSDKTQDVNSSESSFSERNSDLDDARFENPTEESQNLNLGPDHALAGQITTENTPLNNGSAETATSFPISDKIQDGISSKSSFSEKVSDLGNAHFKNSTGESQNPNLEPVMTENATLNNSAKGERKDLGPTAEENRNVSDDSGSVRVQGEVIKGKCNIFNGRWVRDEREAFYDAGSCPYIDRDFNCHKNGRPDDGFLRWRWQPDDCDIPRLNATDFLVRLKGQRLIFVGDSLNRNMWQSLVCILRHSVENKDRVYEAARRRKFKLTGYYSIIFEDYNCSIEYVRSTYLVRGLYDDERLRLDLMDETTKAYREADIVVFNTGHWWTHEKPSKGVDYYQVGGNVYPLLKVMEAYKRALTTWASWVDKYINFNRTQVVFRGYSPTHYRGRQWKSGGQCYKETEPIFNETFLSKYPPKMRAFEEVMEKMKAPVTYLNISRLTDYRKDGHPSIYRKTYNTVREQIAGEKSPDCSHWCLPGIPDTWNELLYASLLLNGRGSWMP